MGVWLPRDGLDDDESLKELIGIWRAGSAELERRQAEVLGILSAEAARLERTAGDARAFLENRVRRLEIQVDKLDGLLDSAYAISTDLSEQTRSWINAGRFADIYAAGGGPGFAWNAPHRAAVEALSRDLFSDVLLLTEYIDGDSKAFVRDLGRVLTGFKLTAGIPVKAQARELSKRLEREFTARGMGSVVYRDGSRHRFGEYAEMLLRTKTGVAYNQGTLNQSRLVGIEFFEILDGALCGLTSHGDGESANGMIVDYATAAAYPLAHPNCRRSLNPRPDLNRDNVGDAVSVQSREAREDQRAFEAALRAQQESGRTGRRSRRTRPARGSRGGSSSAAAAETVPTAAPDFTGLDSLRAAAEEADRLNTGRDEILSGNKKRPDDPGLLGRYGISERQWYDARAFTTEIKKDVREAARAEAETLGEWLKDNSLSIMNKPEAKVQRLNLITGRREYVRTQSGYDFLDQISDGDRSRIARRFVDPRSNAGAAGAPDVLGERIRLVMGTDWSDDEAIGWLLDQWAREDGLRSVASGRLPGFYDPEQLIGPDFANDGYRLSELFSKDLDEAAAHVAVVQKEQAAEYVRRSFPDLGTGLPRPYAMEAAEYVDELEFVEEVLRNVKPISTDPEFGALYSPEDQMMFRRYKELLPPDLDPGPEVSGGEIHAIISDIARKAGLLED